MKPAFCTVHDNDSFKNQRSKMVLDAINAELRLIVEVLVTPLTDAELQGRTRNSFILADGPVTRWHIQPVDSPEVPEWARSASCCYVIGESVSSALEARRLAQDIVIHAEQLLRSGGAHSSSELEKWYDLTQVVHPGEFAR